MVLARTASTPARCQSQDGIDRQAAGAGNTRIPAGAGPGAGRPCQRSSRRQPRYASMLSTFCSSTAGTRASSTRSVRPILQSGVTAGQLPQSRVSRAEGGRVVGGSQQRGYLRQQPAGSRTPGRSADIGAVPRRACLLSFRARRRASWPAGGPPGRQPDRCRACGRQAGTPHRARAVDPERRVARTAPVHSEDQAGVHRERDLPVRPQAASVLRQHHRGRRVHLDCAPSLPVARPARRTVCGSGIVARCSTPRFWQAAAERACGRCPVPVSRSSSIRSPPRTGRCCRRPSTASARCRTPGRSTSSPARPTRRPSPGSCPTFRPPTSWSSRPRGTPARP